MQQKLNETIRVGSLIVSISITLLLVGIFSYLGLEQSRLDSRERIELTRQWDEVIGYILYLLFVLLLVSVCSLISRLKRIRDVMYGSAKEMVGGEDADDIAEQRKVFDKEIRTLWVILGVFNSTYLMRGLWN
jgi:uncharacterized membrane protein